jgi:deazaflavin-dependent oxidoreductase (nitroreductase family)
VTGKAGGAPDQPRSHDQDARFASYGQPWVAYLQRPWGFAADRRIVKWTGFSPMAWINCKQGNRPYTPVLVLTTVGARSGALRERVLPYVVVDGMPVVTGSNSGGAKDPDWVYNLKTFDRCWVQVGRRRAPAVATITQGAERDAVFEVVAREKPNVPRYQERASTFGRLIPLVRLDVRDPAVRRRIGRR